MSGWQWSFLEVAVIPSQIASSHCSTQWTFFKNMFDVFLCFEKKNDHIAYLRRTGICMCVHVWGWEWVGAQAHNHVTIIVHVCEEVNVLKCFPNYFLRWISHGTWSSLIGPFWLAAQTTGITSVLFWTFFSLNAFLGSTGLPGSSPKPRTRMLQLVWLEQSVSCQQLMPSKQPAGVCLRLSKSKRDTNPGRHLCTLLCVFLDRQPTWFPRLVFRLSNHKTPHLFSVLASQFD